MEFASIICCGKRSDRYFLALNLSFMHVIGPFLLLKFENFSVLVLSGNPKFHDLSYTSSVLWEMFNLCSVT